MKIGIYNAYWNTRGGGERYAGFMADVLSRHYPVELIGVEEVDVEDLAAHMGLDLSRTRYRRWPPLGHGNFTARSAEYDLLINSTFWSTLRSGAKDSIYIAYFPQKLTYPRLARVGRRVLLSGSTLLGRVPIPLSGFDAIEDGGYCWSGGNCMLRLPSSLFEQGKASIDLESADPEGLVATVLDVKGREVKWFVEDKQLIVELKGNPCGPVDVELICRTCSPEEPVGSPDGRQLGVCLKYPSNGSGSYRLFRAQQWLNQVERRLSSRDPSFLETYPLILSISEFTAEWVRHRWGRESEILAPPVDTERFSDKEREKKRVILGVGRFFFGSHNKKHIEMVRVFRKMCDQGVVPEGWELHLAGNVHRNYIEDLEYYAEVQRLAEGYPVWLMPDLPYARLQEEYLSAGIFWHAAGWGENPRRRPERFEHFGITTCEAMSAGCVPVVFAGAGQLEILENGETGFLFTEESELIEQTVSLMESHGAPWVLEMSRRARRSVARYGLEAFSRNLLEILRDRGIVDLP